MNKKLLSIILHYGAKHQQKKLAEEYHELQEAITEYLSKVDGDNYQLLRNHVIEEYTDVLILLEQFYEYFDMEDEEIDFFKNKKVERQLERIKNEDN